MSLDPTSSHSDLSERKLRETVNVQGSVRAVTQFSYDGMGRRMCTAARMSPATFASLPGDARTLSLERGGVPLKIHAQQMTIKLNERQHRIIVKIARDLGY